jgi:carbonic anhydrase
MPVELGYIIAGSIAVLILVVVGVRIAERKRADSLREAAERLGLSFDPNAEGILDSVFVNFPLFNRGRSRRFRNLLSGGRGRDQVWLFDYRYVTGHGKNRRVHRRTVAAYPQAARNLPLFELRPERVFEKVLTMFGYQDIDLPEYPEFSGRYLLRGRDEDAIRALFNSKRIAVLEGIKNVGVEGEGSCLVVYRHRRRVPPDQLPMFLDQARMIRDAFGQRLRHEAT